MFYFFVVVMGSFFDPRKAVFPSHIYCSLYGGILIGYLLWLSYIRAGNELGEGGIHPGRILLSLLVFRIRKCEIRGADEK